MTAGGTHARLLPAHQVVAGASGRRAVFRHDLATVALAAGMLGILLAVVLLGVGSPVA